MAEQPLEVYEVGKPYSKTRTTWPEAVDYNYRKGQHEMRMFLANPTQEEEQAVAKGTAEFAVVTVEGLLFLMYQFRAFPPRTGAPAPFPWSDTGFSWWLVPEEDRAMPNPEPTPGERGILHILLIDANTGIIKRQRVITFPPNVSQALEKAIREDAAKPFVGIEEYDKAVARVYQRFPNPAAMLRLTQAKGLGGQP